MKPNNPFFKVLFAGVGLVILWAILWGALVPMVLPSLAWSGYDNLDILTLVFLFGCGVQGVGILRSGH